MRTKEIKIPNEVARFVPSVFGIQVEFVNPFNSYSIFELRNYKGSLIYKCYIEESFILQGLDLYLTESYSLTFENISTREIKAYSVFY